MILAVLALTIGPLGLVRPAWMRFIYVGWTVLAFPIGWTVSLIMLATMFFGLFTPIGLIFRLLGRDLLQRIRHPDLESYWVPKTGTVRPASLLQAVLIERPPAIFTIGMMTMSETTPTDDQSPASSRKRPPSPKRESLVKRVLVVPGSEQEMVAAADHDRHVAPGNTDLAVRRHSSDTIHLHTVLIGQGPDDAELHVHWGSHA